MHIQTHAHVPIHMRKQKHMHSEYAETAPILRRYLTGEDKWIAQLWLHERSYSPTVPAGSSQAEAAGAVRAFAEAHGLRVPESAAV